MKKCAHCSKPSVLHITELSDGKVHAVHLCESCAKDYLSGASKQSSAPELQSESEAEGDSELSELELTACPNCGITFQEFRAQGRLGCAHDYIAFQSELIPLLENIHGGSARGGVQHCGKIPRRAPQSSQQQFQLIHWKKRLKEAIEDELYEEAARIRDEIAAIEKELGGEHGGH